MNNDANVNDSRPVLILGAGINGCCLARELVLNGVPVVLVDKADIATGATAKSSRLIHGGVRYLEYGDFHLVAESLAERERLLTLAPQFVKPLRLHIPVRRRLGGFVQSAFRFLKLSRFSLGRKLSSWLSISSERGMYVVRMGLWMYDIIARSSLLPSSEVHRLGEAGVPAVDATKFKWVCTYSDAQMWYPERFVIALLQDARRHATQHGVSFEVLTYHETELRAGKAVIRNTHNLDVDADADGGNAPERCERKTREIEPAVIVNATGAWGDLTLQDLHVDTQRLFGGTKGSHIITRHAGLLAAIGDGGIYAEASDGRLVFVLPSPKGVLIGTTDVRIDGSPGDVIASEDEIAYLVGMVNSVFADLDFRVDDVDSHYCGVRPLPYVASGKTGSISRGHSIHTTHHADIPLHTLIGGKLTTCRAFGEEVADLILRDLERTRCVNTRERPIPGAVDYPEDADVWSQQVADETGHPVEEVRCLFDLMGTDCRDRLTATPGDTLLPDLRLCAPIIQAIIEQEWVFDLSDLVERRLAMVLGDRVTGANMEALANCLVAVGRLDPDRKDKAIRQCRESTQRRYGIDGDGPTP